MRHNSAVSTLSTDLDSLDVYDTLRVTLAETVEWRGLLLALRHLKKYSVPDPGLVSSHTI